MVEQIKKNESEQGENEYQGQKVKHLNQQHTFLKNHVGKIVTKILSCIQERFATVYLENIKREGNSSKFAMSAEGDTIIFDVCQVLNTATWPDSVGLEESSALEKQLEKQLSAVTHVYNRYEKLFSFSVDDIRDSYVDIVHYVGEYFTVADCNTLHIWQRLGKLQQCKENMKAGMLLVELCL